MAWTSPRTWVALEIPTAANMNAEVRDNLKAIGDPWTPYTPIWTCDGTAPAIGDGTLTGAYIAAGKLIHFWATLTAGTTTTYGTSNWRLSLPVNEKPIRWTFPGNCRDVSALNTYPMAGEWDGGTGTIVMRLWPTTAGSTWRIFNGGTIPFTWAAGDLLNISGSYEAA